MPEQSVHRLETTRWIGGGFRSPIGSFSVIHELNKEKKEMRTGLPLQTACTSSPAQLDRVEGLRAHSLDMIQLTLICFGICVQERIAGKPDPSSAEHADFLKNRKDAS